MNNAENTHTPHPCGATRPGTLGYQRCVLTDEHATHRSQDGQSFTDHEMVATQSLRIKATESRDSLAIALAAEVSRLAALVDQIESAAQYAITAPGEGDYAMGQDAYAERVIETIENGRS